MRISRQLFPVVHNLLEKSRYREDDHKYADQVGKSVVNWRFWRSLVKLPQHSRGINQRMKILFTFYVPSGGVETLNRQRCSALNRKGIECHYLYTQEGTGLQNKINAPIFIARSDQEIQDIVNRENYTAIVVGSDLLLLQKLRESGYRGILIYEVQGLGFNKEYAEYFVSTHAFPILRDYCDALLYPRTPHLISVFDKMMPFKKRYSFHNCMDLDSFKYEARAKISHPVVGWVGRLEENKNWRDFLAIGAELIKQNRSIKLWMFEDNTLAQKTERAAFEQKVAELDLQRHLTIYANQPHHKMAGYFSVIGDSGGFLCSTSKVEGFGYAVLEAMLCRCPVLSTDSDGVRSFIIHDVTGKFFELGNINQAVQEATQLMANSRLRETIRVKGVRHIEQHFSPDKYANHFIRMIHDLGRSHEEQ